MTPVIPAPSPSSPSLWMPSLLSPSVNWVPNTTHRVPAYSSLYKSRYYVLHSTSAPGSYSDLASVWFATFASCWVYTRSKRVYLPLRLSSPVHLGNTWLLEVYLGRTPPLGEQVLRSIRSKRTYPANRCSWYVACAGYDHWHETGQASHS